MTFPANTSGIYCPGCGPNDFPQSHICGIPTNVASPTMQWLPLFLQPEPSKPCDHCFCLTQKAGYYESCDARGWTKTHYLKRHRICCMCDTRRVKEQP